MSQERIAPLAEDRVSVISDPAPTERHDVDVAAATAGGRGWFAAALAGLALLLVVVIGGVATSPFWAPAVTSLLPWGSRGDRASAALSARVAALEQHPAASAADVTAVKTAQAALATRVAALEEDAAAAKTASAERTRRLDAVAAEAQGAAAGAAALGTIRQELTGQGAAAAGMADRLAALEQKVTSQADRSGALTLLALLEMRDAVDDARPFPSEYASFTNLAARDPGLLTAAKPLAASAGDGVASRAELDRQLSSLADQLAAVNASDAKPQVRPRWWGWTLDRLRGLVTIRRIDEAEKTGPQAAVTAARAALAKGDLAAAITAIDKLGGADAAVAEPWLRMARRRLAAEAALSRLQELLTAGLASASTADAAKPGAPSTPAPAATNPSADTAPASTSAAQTPR